LEFQRRVEQEDVPDVPWVLVASPCDDIPIMRKVEAAIIAVNSPSIVAISFFLANDKFLYIIGFSDKGRHGTCVAYLMEAMVFFKVGFPLFYC
jgi:hypothetical protein